MLALFRFLFKSTIVILGTLLVVFVFAAMQTDWPAQSASPSLAPSLSSWGTGPKVFMVFPGWRLEQVAESLTINGIMDGQSFKDVAVQGTTVNHSLLDDRPANKSYEGYLFPGIYHLSASPTPEELITQMLVHMADRLPPNAQQLAQTQGLSLFEALTLASIVITAVFMLIIPQFKSVLDEMVGSRLNTITTAFFTITANIIPFWIGVGVLVAAILIGLAFLSTSADGRRFKESLFMKIPVIGRIYHSSILGRMAEAMAMMVAAGCDMPASLRLSSGATGSEKLILESEAIAGQIEQGANILEAGQFCRTIPRLFLYSIQLGTQRNELQDNLHSLGQMYAEQARCGQSRLQVVLLPIMIVLVGSVIATAVLAMFLPMIQVINALNV